MKETKQPLEILFAEPPFRSGTKTFLDRIHKGMNLLLTSKKESLTRVPDVYVLWASSLDDEFTRWLTTHKEAHSRFLLLGTETSSDTMVKHVLNLGLRKWNRFYTVEFPEEIDCKQLKFLLSRLCYGLVPTEGKERILDARVESDTLKIVSTDFEKLKIPLTSISALKHASADDLKNFELDEDGAFIYWPTSDVHLGWQQLSAIVYPERSLRAKQRSASFNKSFGEVLRHLRENAGLTQSDISGLSERQVQRIEHGLCRATSKAIYSYAESVKMHVEVFLEEVAASLKTDDDSDKGALRLLKKCIVKVPPHSR